MRTWVSGLLTLCGTFPGASVAHAAGFDPEAAIVVESLGPFPVTVDTYEGNPWIGNPECAPFANGTAVCAVPAAATLGGPTEQVWAVQVDPAQGVVVQVLVLDVGDLQAPFESVAHAYVMPDSDVFETDLRIRYLDGPADPASLLAESVVAPNAQGVAEGQGFARPPFDPDLCILDLDAFGVNLGEPLLDGDRDTVFTLARGPSADAVIDVTWDDQLQAWSCQILAQTGVALPGTQTIVNNFTMARATPGGTLAIALLNETYVAGNLVPHPGATQLRIDKLEVIEVGADTFVIRLDRVDSNNEDLLSQNALGTASRTLMSKGDPVVGGGTLSFTVDFWAHLDGNVFQVGVLSDNLYLGVEPPPPPFSLQAPAQGAATPGPLALHRVLGPGDMVDGKTVSSIVGVGGSPQANSVIGMTLGFDDGSVGYYVAYNPVQDVPSLGSEAAWLVAVGLMALVGSFVAGRMFVS